MKMLEEFLVDVKRFPGMALLSVITIALTLFVTGLFSLLYINIADALERFGERVQMVKHLGTHSENYLLTCVGQKPGFQILTTPHQEGSPYKGDGYSANSSKITILYIISPHTNQIG